jgi:hypothetical protein
MCQAAQWCWWLWAVAAVAAVVVIPGLILEVQDRLPIPALGLLQFLLLDMPLVCLPSYILFTQNKNGAV